MNLFRVFIRSVGFLGGTFLLSNPKLDLVINESVSNVGFDLKIFQKSRIVNYNLTFSSQY